MMDEFSKLIMEKTGKTFNGNKRRIRYDIFKLLFKYLNSFSMLSCLAHVINLATQALIKTYTKSKHYNPASPEDHMPITTGNDRDEVGLIRAISVKVCHLIIL